MSYLSFLNGITCPTVSLLTMKMRKTLWTMPVCSAKKPFYGHLKKCGMTLSKWNKTRYWTEHSVRVGGAIQLDIEGYSLPQIMEMGGTGRMKKWLMRYIRNIRAGKKAMISLCPKCL